MTDIAVFCFAAAFGFAVSGVLSSAYAIVARRDVDFAALQPTLAGNLLAVAVVMFTGPSIVAGKVIAGLRSERFGVPLALLGTALALLWSLIAGLFYLNIVVAL